MTKGKRPNYSPYSMAPQNLNWKRGQWLGGFRRMEILFDHILSDLDSVPEEFRDELQELAVRGKNIAIRADKCLRSIPKKGK